MEIVTLLLLLGVVAMGFELFMLIAYFTYNAVMYDGYVGGKI